MFSDVAPSHLTWDEVDPARHRFDPADAARVVRSSHEVGQVWADALSSAIAEHYGRWTLGWRWAHDEGDFDDGPIGVWCCPRDSITTQEETLASVVAALCEWRAWLEQLAGWFAERPLALTDVEDQRADWRGGRRPVRELVQSHRGSRRCGRRTARAGGAAGRCQARRRTAGPAGALAGDPRDRALAGVRRREPGGPVRYGIDSDTRARFDACLAESASDTLGLIARAARAYLDVCFFHPFEDGNARAAFLTVLFVLAREGIGLNSVSLLRRVTFQAGSAGDPLILARSIDLHLRGTRS